MSLSPSPSPNRRRWWLGLLVVVLAVLLSGGRLAAFWTDVLWFRSLGYGRVYSTVLLTRVGLGLVGGLLAGGLVAGNVLLAGRLAPDFRIPSPQEEGIERYRAALAPYVRPLALGLGAVVGLLSGLAVAGEWRTVLLWANATPFDRVDPQFGLDLSFFVHRLPLYTALDSWLFTTLVLVVVLVLAAHYVFGGLRPQSVGQRISPQANVHLSLLLAAAVGVRGVGSWLDRYQLSYSERGVTTGLSYTDATAQLPAHLLLTVIAGVCVVLFLVNLRVRNPLLPAAGVGILAVAAVVLSGVYPAVIQRVQVEPQELARERPYIERGLALTRFGYGIELAGDQTDRSTIAFDDFPAATTLSDDAVADNRATLENVRLWDPNIVGSVYQQLQGLRRFFDFRDVDVDRYEIDGEQQQVDIAVRELNPSRLPDSSWQNQHLVYTHGFGLVASDVSRKTAAGEPEFLAEDIPPTGIEELALDQPRVYFGEQGPLYSVVGTEAAELDYVSNEEDSRSFTYDGQDGVGIGSLLRRLAFAVRFAEPNLVLSGLLTDDSRILYRRDVEERAGAVAPFLEFDGDPYPAVVDGRVRWILDAYTTSEMLPYSLRQDLGSLTSTQETVVRQVARADGSLALQEDVETVSGLDGTANYVRNSVKAVVDAYDGTVTLYVMDADDPLIRSWDRAFPGVLTPVAQAPEALRAHFRYPEDLLRVQASVFTRYHVAEPDVFYSSDDEWSIPVDAAELNNAATPPAEGREPRLRPYYLQLRLPGQAEEEFALVQPFNPLDRPNLIAWMAARSDPEHYGELRAYRMPDSQNVPGTEQVQAQINQNGEIAPQITLLSEAGSDIVYGNLLIIPIDESLLYAQPLFVRAEQGQIPELRFVVLSLGGRIVAEPTLEESLVALFGEAAPVEEPPGDPDPGGDPGGPAGDGVDPAVAGLITQALAAFEAAQAALEEGDLGAYQEATERAGDLLRRAGEASGADLPTPGATPTAAATPAANG